MQLPTLYQFFRHQVQHGFREHGLAEPATIDYVSDILTRFAETQALYPLRDAEGEPLERIADMLMEWYRAQGWEDRAPDRYRQTRVVRHIAEYTLFMSGLFREWIAGQGQLDYYLDHGRSAYWQCADREPNPQRQRLFRQLCVKFADITSTLDHMRRHQFPLPPQPPGTDTVLSALWRV